MFNFNYRDARLAEQKIREKARLLEKQSKEFLNKLDKKEFNKMTREEAISKIISLTKYGPSGHQGWLVDQLEALGLLKFDKKIEGKSRKTPKELIQEVGPYNALTNPYQASIIIEHLQNHGYSIVDNTYCSPREIL